MKKTLSLLVALLLVLQLFAGCGGNNGNGNGGGANDGGGNSGAGGTNTGDTGDTGGSTTPEKKIFLLSDTGTVDNFSPFSGNISICDYVQAKLYNYFPEDVEGSDRSLTTIKPELADGEPTTEDGYTWYIKINPDAKWANGEPIK